MVSKTEINLSLKRSTCSSDPPLWDNQLFPFLFKACAPRLEPHVFWGKWWPLPQTLRALIRWPESQSTPLVTPHYFTSYTLKIPGFSSSIDRGRLVSVVIKSERQTKEQRGQQKRLAKTKTKHAHWTGKKINHAFSYNRHKLLFHNSVFMFKVFAHWEDTLKMIYAEISVTIRKLCTLNTFFN